MVAASVTYGCSLRHLWLQVSGVLLPGFSPSRRWRFGFGARSGPNYAMLEERHDVRAYVT